MPRSCSDWIESFVTLTQDTEPPESFRRWVAIGVIAACLQRKCSIVWDKIVYPNKYIILVAPAGKARKSSAINIGRSFLEEVGVTIAPEATTREALIRRIRNSMQTESDGVIPITHSSLTVFSSEMTVFLGFKNQQLISDLCDWYDCTSPWRYETKDRTKADFIENLWVNVIAGTTPESLQASLPPEAIGGGLTSRMVFVYEREKGKVIFVPSGINTRLLNKKYDNKKAREVEALRELMVEDLFKILIMKGEFAVDESFLDVMIPWRDIHEKDPPFQHTPLSAYSERRVSHLIKMSMIISAARRDDMSVTGEDLLKAIDILETTEKNMLHVFAGVGRSDQAAIMSKVIGVLAAKGEIKRSELMEIMYYDTDIENLNRVLGTLRVMGSIEWKQEGVDGTIRYIRKEE